MRVVLQSRFVAIKLPPLDVMFLRIVFLVHLWNNNYSTKAFIRQRLNRSVLWKNLILCLKIICAFSDLRLNVLCDPEITVKVWKHLHIISLLKHTSHYVQILNIEMSRLLQELTGVVTFGNLELVLKGNGIGKKSGTFSWEQKVPSTPGSNKLWLQIQFLSLNLVF